MACEDELSLQVPLYVALPHIGGAKSPALISISQINNHRPVFCCLDLPASPACTSALHTALPSMLDRLIPDAQQLGETATEVHVPVRHSLPPGSRIQNLQSLNGFHIPLHPRKPCNVCQLTQYRGCIDHSVLQILQSERSIATPGRHIDRDCYHNRALIAEQQFAGPTRSHSRELTQCRSSRIHAP